MRLINPFTLFQKFSLFRPSLQFVTVVIVSLTGLLLAWLSLPGLAQADAPGTVKNSVKIASGLNGGPTLANNDFFGTSVTEIGDLNQDGVQDLISSTYSDDTGGPDRGAVYVMFMKMDGTVSSSVKIASGLNGGPPLMNSDSFGSSSYGIGDLNRDGVEDLAVGAYFDDTGGTDRGALYILFMRANGTVSSSVKIASGLNGGPTLMNDGRFGVSVSGTGDLNRDGINDLAVGAYTDSTGGPGRGAFYVLFMKADGTVSSSVKIASGLNGGPILADLDVFGVFISGVGDLNRDGIEDLAVGAYTDDTGGLDRGAVYILFMKADGTVNSSVKIASGLNGSPVLADHDQFGTSVTKVGDLNRDGVEDLAVGAYFDDTGGTDRGAVYVLLMKSDGTVASNLKLASGLNGGPVLADGDQFGQSLTDIGDLNRDGFTDLAVGVLRDDTGGTNRGAVYILSLDRIINSPNGAIDQKKIAHNLNGGPSLTNDDRFGVAATRIGDLNRDGVQDLAVGAYRDDTGGTDRGALHILLMQANGTVGSHVKIAHLTNGGPALEDSDIFGVAVSRIGDLNRDGVEDLVVGASGDDAGTDNRGAIYVLFMRADGTVSNSVKISHLTNGGPPLNTSDIFGVSVSGIGDLDRDGIEDLAVGADLDDTGGFDRGVFYVLLLNTNGTAKSYIKIGHNLNGGPSLSNEDYFGNIITPIGDLNRDGVQDLAVGAVADDTGGTDRGAFYVLLMNTNGTVKSHVKIAHNFNGGPPLVNGDQFGVALTEISDLNRDGVEDLVAGASLDDTGGLDRGAIYLLLLNANGTVKNYVKIAHNLMGVPSPKSEI